jgi:threonylcarbamoyladenosine tRNA methylthiotransferase MtaB
MIAGFPTEDDSMAERSLSFVEEAELDLLHVFPFSPRAGTPAARMPQVPAATIRARAAALRELAAERKHVALRRFIGKTVDALVEQQGLGRSEHYLPVRVPESAEEGQIRRVRIVGADDTALIAEGAR